MFAVRTTKVVNSCVNRNIRSIDVLVTGTLLESNTLNEVCPHTLITVFRVVLLLNIFDWHGGVPAF
jgi:hypothetical protein